jgi:nucleoid-associated protein YgaU
LSALRRAGESAAALRTELDAVKAKLAETQKAAESHGATVAELTGLNEKLTNEKAAAEKQADQFRQTAEQARAELAELRNRVNANDQVAQAQHARLDELTATNEKLTAQTRDLTAQVTTLQAAADSAAALRADLDAVKARLAEAQQAAEGQGSTVAELTGTNEKLSADLKDLQAQLAALRSENAKLADAEQRAAGLATASAQLTAAQRDLAALRAENTRLADTLQATDRDRAARIAQLQQDNAAISARLRQAQGTLDQIASAARLINGGAGLAPGGGSFVPTTATSSVPTIAVQPPAPVAPVQPRVHVVQEGDSLTRISVRYYGTGGRWQEIYDANREILKGENALRPGQRLRIP